MNVRITKHQHGYKVTDMDGNKVLADFWGKDAKEKALDFIKEKGFKLAHAC